MRWVAESTCPFDIVNDPGFLTLMKTGRPHYYIPSSMMVSCDVRYVFVQARRRLAAKLQVRRHQLCVVQSNQKLTYLKAYKGELNFAMDTWTAPNHHAFFAVTVHLEERGEMSMIPLDIWEIPRVSGMYDV